MLIKIQPDATVCRYLFTAKSLHVSSVTAPIIRSTKAVTAASGTGHNTGTATSLQRGQILILWPIPEAAVTVFRTPDDGRCDTWNMYSDFEVNKYLHTFASAWIFIKTELWCMEPWAFFFIKKKVTQIIRFIHHTQQAMQSLS